MAPQEVINLIKECGLNIEQPLHDIVADYLITLLEKQIPKKPIRFHEEYNKHKWERNTDNSIDEERWERYIHEGIICERRGTKFHPACIQRYDSYKFVISDMLCPTCNSDTFTGELCQECDPLIDWRKEDV